jgi:hypothetical protein
MGAGLELLAGYCAETSGRIRDWPQLRSVENTDSDPVRPGRFAVA